MVGKGGGVLGCGSVMCDDEYAMYIPDTPATHH